LNGKNIQSDKHYIIPEDIDNSYIINKLMGVNFYGSKMPLNESLPVYEIETIVGWVKNGAKYEEN